MYKAHPSFTPPADDTVLWRYMDFTKFVSLLDRSELFFARADKLEDPFEGSFTVKNEELYAAALEKQYEEQWWMYRLSDSSPEKDLLRWAASLKDDRKRILICCWHESSHESAAMWRLYARETDGIAIKTDFSSFKQSLRSDEDIYIGKVDYVDYEHYRIPENNLFNPYLYKRQDFNHEREVRAIATTFPKSADEINQPPKICDMGQYYEVDLSLLIKEVIVAPYADEWFLELVQSVVVSRYELEVPVVRSNLAQKPIWDREQAEE